MHPTIERALTIVTQDEFANEVIATVQFDNLTAAINGDFYEPLVDLNKLSMLLPMQLNCASVTVSLDVKHSVMCKTLGKFVKHYLHV